MERFPSFSNLIPKSPGPWPSVEDDGTSGGRVVYDDKSDKEADEHLPQQPSNPTRHHRRKSSMENSIMSQVLNGTMPSPSSHHHRRISSLNSEFVANMFNNSTPSTVLGSLESIYDQGFVRHQQQSNNDARFHDSFTSSQSPAQPQRKATEHTIAHTRHARRMSQDSFPSFFDPTIVGLGESCATTRRQQRRVSLENVFYLCAGSVLPQVATARHERNQSCVSALSDVSYGDDHDDTDKDPYFCSPATSATKTSSTTKKKNIVAPNMDVFAQALALEAKGAPMREPSSSSHHTFAKYTPSLSKGEEEAPRHHHHHRRQLSRDSATGYLPRRHRRHASRDLSEALPPLLVLQDLSLPSKHSGRLSSHHRNTSTVSDISFDEESLLLSTTTTDDEEEMEVAPSIASSLGIMDYSVGTASKTTAEPQQGIIPHKSGLTFADFAPSSAKHQDHQEGLRGNGDDDTYGRLGDTR